MNKQIKKVSVERAPSPGEGRRALLDVSDADLGQIHALYVAGLNLQAWELCKRIGPIRQWAGADARIMAGRLAGNLGGIRLARWFHIKAWRDQPGHPKALYYYARAMMDRQGVYQVWRFMAQRMGEMEGVKGWDSVRADWLAFGATVAATLRDFGTAEAMIGKAMGLAGERPWIWIERSYVYQQQDRWEDALKAARKSLELRAWYRPGVQAAAQILAHLNRDDEALALLREAGARTESAPIMWQLATMLSEAQQYEEARRVWDRVEELSPLADRDFVRFLAARRSDAAYDCGAYTTAAELARQVGVAPSKAAPKIPGFFDKVAERLSQDLTGKKRVELDVPFVQQHHMTCAPATLSAVSQYWKRPAEHLEIVEAICYDGTSCHSERAWAEGRGYVCREFKVTWDAAVGLIDRGVPFTLATVEVTNAHLQAVIGYDARRGTLLLRDPSFKYTSEILVEGLEERYKATGPRGMALVPADRVGELLKELELPEAALYDKFNDVQRALVAHKREDAKAACEALEAMSPGHRLAHWARRSLAAYDADPVAQLAAMEELIKQFPEDQALQLQKLGLLRNMTRRSEMLATLEQMCGNPKNDPIFWQQLAQELGTDHREIPRAVGLLGRCLRYRPTDAGTYYTLAGMLWDLREFDQSLECYRFATCLNDKDDWLAGTFFNSSRFLKRTDEALAMLRDRFARFAARSCGPAKTLFRALTSVDRAKEAFEVLEEGLKRRPDDSELLLHAADAYARYGNFDRAQRLLEKARDKSHAAQYRRARAQLANFKGELASALAQWQKVLEAEPLAVDAHDTVATLLAETQSREAAVQHLRGATARFEHHYPLHQIYFQWLRQGEQVEYERVVRRLLESRPGDGWLMRELALCLTRQAKMKEAVAAAEESLRLEPNETSSHGVASRVYEVAGKLDQAKRHARRALELNVDNESAMAELMDLSPGLEDRREALRFICEQLVKQVTTGDGLLAYRQVATTTLDDQETLGTLDAALAARPDLWHAWSAKGRQLVDMNRVDEAIEVLKRGTERFSLLPRMWVDLASAQAIKGDHAGASESLTRALQIAPGWGPAVRQLASSKVREGDYAAARKLLEGAIAWAPLDPANYGEIADVEWKMGQRESAIERLRKAVNLAPAYDWAWGMLKQWGAELNRPELAGELARELTVKRAGEGRSWYLLARMLEGDGDQVMAERLEALEKALSLEPLELDFHDLKATLLAQAKRFEEAMAACRPGAFAEAPLRLRGRAAWLSAIHGNLEKAIEEMLNVVREDPRYFWGWSMLAQWYRELNQHEGYANAARQLTTLAPHDPVSWGYLAEALERNQDAAGAAQAYRRAFELDPQYSFGGFGAFDLQLQAGDLSGAEATLDMMERHERNSFVVARRVQLRCRQGDQARTVETFKGLCALKEVDANALKMVSDTLIKAGWRGSVERVLELALAREGTAPTVGEEWVSRMAETGRWGDVENMLAKLPQPVGQPVACAYMEELSRWGQEPKLLSFQKRNGELLRSNNTYWSSMGAALAGLQLYRAAAKWLSDWERRGELEQWMFLNLATSLRVLRRHEEAARVTAKALVLKPGATELTLRLWAALDQAVGREDRSARDNLERAGEQLSEYQTFLRDVTQVLLAHEESGDFGAARAALGRAVAKFAGFRESMSGLSAYRLAVGAIARRAGFAGWVWRLWRYFCVPPRGVRG